MLHRVFSSFLYLVLFLILVSCASVDDRTTDILTPGMGDGMQKFPAWEAQALSNEATGKNRAVNELLQQADKLIADNLLDQASDKLERLLRIAPSSAQAWSRLSWIALESNMPGRTRQMAQRSNSYARSHKLKALNWFFIRETGFVTGDEDVIKHAESMIRSFNASTDDFVNDSAGRY